MFSLKLTRDHNDLTYYFAKALKLYRDTSQFLAMFCMDLHKALRNEIYKTTTKNLKQLANYWQTLAKRKIFTELFDCILLFDQDHRVYL